jgi:hypothetical protein
MEEVSLDDLILAGGLRARVHRPAGESRPVAVALTHGAGSDLDAKGLVAAAAALAARGHLACRFNLPYRQEGRGSPPKAEESVPGFAAAFEDIDRRVAPARRWVAGGRSYGGRVASLAVASGDLAGAVGLLFYSYPLHPPGAPDKLRVAHWPEIACPSLFIAGTRDPYCDLARLSEHLPRLGARATLHVVEGGDHGLAVRARDAADGRRRTEEAAAAEVADVVGAWLDGL